MKFNALLSTLFFSIVLLTSCSNSTGTTAADSLKDTAGQTSWKTDTIKPAPAQQPGSFPGKWSYNNGDDLLEISQNGAMYNVMWKSKADGFVEHEINCALVNNELIGDYYGAQKNMRLKMSDDQLLFSVDPFAEFAPIKEQVFTRVN